VEREVLFVLSCHRFLLSVFLCADIEFVVFGFSVFRSGFIVRTCQVIGYKVSDDAEEIVFTIFG